MPVVATPEAAAGLDATDGTELLLAEGPAGFAEALAWLVEDGSMVRRIVEAGRGLLARRHEPRRVGQQLMEIYRQAVRSAGG